MFGFEVSTVEEELSSFPTHLGGLGINDPTQIATRSYKTSEEMTRSAVDSIKTGCVLDIHSHNTHLKKIAAQNRKTCEEEAENKLTMLMLQLDLNKMKTIERTAKGKNSTWLNAIPLARYHFDLSPNQFRVSGLTPRGLPAWCDGCGKKFDVTHALDCRKGGLITRRHNEIRDTLCDISAFVWPQVKKEVVVKESNESGLGGLIADFSVRGVWEPQVEALFDVRVINADAPSFCDCSIEALLKDHEHQKKSKYNGAILPKRRNFF